MTSRSYAAQHDSPGTSIPSRPHNRKCHIAINLPPHSYIPLSIVYLCPRIRGGMPPIARVEFRIYCTEMYSGCMSVILLESFSQSVQGFQIALHVTERGIWSFSIYVDGTRNKVIDKSSPDGSCVVIEKVQVQWRMQRRVALSCLIHTTGSFVRFSCWMITLY